MIEKNNIFKNLLRADLYRILAMGFGEPNSENLEALEEVLGDFLNDLPEGSVTKEIQDSLGQIFSTLQEARDPDKTRSSLEEEYNRLFANQVFCSPFEGTYHAVERGPILGDITAFYKAFQMETPAQEGPPDALKMELGFLSFMALKEAYALEKGLQEEAAITHEAQGKFLKDHLGRWVPLFAERLLVNSSHPFYSALSQVLKVWVERECDHFQVSPAVLLPAFGDSYWDESVHCSLGH